MEIGRLEKGRSAPLGATIFGDGVNFSLFSEHARAVELCVFDDLGQLELRRIPLTRRSNHIWSVWVQGLTEGTKYGYRVHGEYAPEQGHRFNPNKVLIDPYARALDRSFCWDRLVYGYDPRSPQKDLSFSDMNNASTAVKSVVVEKRSAAEIEAIQEKKPYTPWSETIIYEAHVRGISQLNLTLPSEDRGTFSGLGHPDTIKYLKNLGVTAVELLPIHSFVDEEFLTLQGLSNYWGYNTLNFFTAHSGYLQSGKKDEFLGMVDALHSEGLELILDVVYNHTAESNELGPTLSFRGLDNKSYYRLVGNKNQHYINDTGCGNTLRIDHPNVMRMVLDSLRYWAGEMGVDGFRFDLASILGRDEKGYSTAAAFFQAVNQDPLLSTCKMIAEPWDIGPGGYQLGAFPGQWSEWNDKYRDVSRRFWRGDHGLMPEFSRRLHGSSDVFEYAKRKPRASVNFIASHDGFTLADMVSFKERNNLANKENNRDGHNANFSDNYGVEGPSDDQVILSVRRRQQRNLLATLMFSHGTPMILGGDEFGRSQQGNNNAYCQDNEINWFDWNSTSQERSNLITFTQKIIEVRKSISLFSTPKFIHGPSSFEKEGASARWLSTCGKLMTADDWNNSKNNILGWLLKQSSEDVVEVVLLLFNASVESVKFTLPEEPGVTLWESVLDTCSEDGEPEVSEYPDKHTLDLPARSMLLLKAK